MTAPSGRARRSRADFERNRSEIVTQAERHFAESGVGASLEAVARDAGVGSATLYRHFPTRDALLAEVLQRRTDTLEASKARIEQLDDPDAALEAWLAALEEYFGAFDGLSGPLRSALAQEHNPLTLTCIGFIHGTDHFLRAAQQHGSARQDVRGRDLFLAVLATSWVRGASLADDEAAGRLRGLMRDGYRR
ncbi:TetR/AcrR family transcriptional regulator [Aeromicrobium massiliense]|uniref:TetR/AcrR family transcriptional regulator n=1 Tax=Aeromicrobium massiliense TaxID=1464554 RepID=UPI00031A3119|nr:helix-turn-helix domain-containing protein [Aeromicrobium massiliense]